MESGKIWFGNKNCYYEKKINGTTALISTVILLACISSLVIW